MGKKLSDVESLRVRSLRRMGATKAEIRSVLKKGRKTKKKKATRRPAYKLEM